MSKVIIPRYVKTLYMHFLSNEAGWLDEFYKCDGSIDFVDKYTIGNSKFQRDFVAKILADKLKLGFEDRLHQTHGLG